MPTAEYFDKIKDKIDTGDLLLFAGRGVASGLIRLGQSIRHGVEASRFTHVGMAYRDPTDGSLHCTESTTLSNLVDEDTGRALSGVQTVPLYDRVETYEGGVAVRRLEVERTEEMLTAFDEFRAEVIGRPYEGYLFDLVKAAMKFDDAEDLGTLFCSELVAEYYQRMKLLDSTRSSDSWSPAEFATLASDSLVRGVLHPVEWIKKLPDDGHYRPRTNTRRPRR